LVAYTWKGDPVVYSISPTSDVAVKLDAELLVTWDLEGKNFHPALIYSHRRKGLGKIRIAGWFQLLFCLPFAYNQWADVCPEAAAGRWTTARWVCHAEASSHRRTKSRGHGCCNPVLLGFLTVRGRGEC